jgi:hypothetical protein
VGSPYRHQVIRVRIAIRGQRRHPFNESWLNNTEDHQQRRETSCKYLFQRALSYLTTGKIVHRQETYSLHTKTIAEFRLNKNKLYDTSGKTPYTCIRLSHIASVVRNFAANPNSERNGGHQSLTERHSALGSLFFFNIVFPSKEDLPVFCLCSLFSLQSLFYNFQNPDRVS